MCSTYPLTAGKLSKRVLDFEGGKRFSAFYGVFQDCILWTCPELSRLAKRAQTSPGIRGCFGAQDEGPGRSEGEGKRK